MKLTICTRYASTYAERLTGYIAGCPGLEAVLCPGGSTRATLCTDPTETTPIIIPLSFSMPADWPASVLEEHPGRRLIAVSAIDFGNAFSRITAETGIEVIALERLPEVLQLGA